MRYAEAFASYGVKLKNPQWSVCGVNAAGELAISLWAHHFGKPKGNMQVCIDKAARWSGPGNAEFRRSMELAFKTGQVLRAVIAKVSAKDEAAIESGADASKVRKEFSVKKDWYGKVVAWNGEDYVIEFIDRSRQGRDD